MADRKRRIAELLHAPANGQRVLAKLPIGVSGLLLRGFEVCDFLLQLADPVRQNLHGVAQALGVLLAQTVLKIVAGTAEQASVAAIAATAIRKERACMEQLLKSRRRQTAFERHRVPP